MRRAWAIKLGSAGRCVPFCENHHIVGVGWYLVDEKILRTAIKDELWRYLQEGYKDQSPSGIGQWTGSLYRFSHEIEVGDYILYYDPNQKWVRICKVEGDLKRRDFDLEGLDTEKEEVDIWFCRQAEVVATVPVLELDGVLKGKILEPRGTCWELSDCHERVDAIVHGIG